jgi:SAM-dependent methyltransferase
MDEVWRILKPGGQMIATFPYAGSPGYWWDPTHVNPISHVTLAYFDPLARDPGGNLYNFYSIYRPKPWKVVRCFYDTNGFIEVAMDKRAIDPSYHTMDDSLKS